MKRREFITLLGGAALTLATAPREGRAQQARPVIGFLNAQTAVGFAHLVTAFRNGLGETGLREGENVAIEYRWADGHHDRLRAMADELIRRRVSVIVATGGAQVVAHKATTTIPIVASFGGNPVDLGLVASINRPGGNLTGVSVLNTDLEAKRLEQLHELVPKDAILGILIDPTFPDAQNQLQQVEAAARTLGRQVRVLNISNDGEINKIITVVADQRISALVVVGSPLFLNRRGHLLAVIAQLRIPAIFENREFTQAGGLMSYGTSVPDVYRQVGVYTGRVLKGERPAELPVLQPTRFDISINLKTAKALGIEVPTSILLRADEVIE